jgi:hypothetical protein
MFQQVFHQSELATRVVITFQVMAFSGMSPGYPDGIGPFPQGGQGELGAHAAGAGDTDHADIGGVFHSADPGQIRCTVAAPVAEKAYDFRFPIGHVFLSVSWLISVELWQVCFVSITFGDSCPNPLR